MKAAIYKGIKQVALEELEKPKAGAKDIVIKVVHAGICGTDVGAYLHGGDPVGIYPNNQFGHEFVGLVDEVGAEVKDIKVGMRVTIDPTNRRPQSCGKSAAEIADMSGAFSQYVWVEEAELNRNVFIIPDELPLEKAVLTEPLSVSTHGVRQAKAKPGDKAIVYGSGTIGMAAVVALQKQGVKDIIVSDVNDFKLSVAKTLGVKVCNPNQKKLTEFVREEWGGTDSWNADIVLDCCGAPFVMKEFVENAKPHSTFVMVAINVTPAEVSPFLLLAKELVLTGSCGYKAEDIQLAIETLNDPDCKLPNIITHHFKQTDVVEAFAEASNAQKAIKVVLDYD